MSVEPCCYTPQKFIQWWLERIIMYNQSLPIRFGLFVASAICDKIIIIQSTQTPKAQIHIHTVLFIYTYGIPLWNSQFSHTARSIFNAQYTRIHAINILVTVTVFQNYVTVDSLDSHEFRHACNISSSNGSLRFHLFMWLLLFLWFYFLCHGYLHGMHTNTHAHQHTSPNEKWIEIPLMSFSICKIKAVFTHSLQSKTSTMNRTNFSFYFCFVFFFPFFFDSLFFILLV